MSMLCRYVQAVTSQAIRSSTISPEASTMHGHRYQLSSERVPSKTSIHIPEEKKELVHSVCSGRRSIVDHIDDTRVFVSRTIFTVKRDEERRLLTFFTPLAVQLEHAPDVMLWYIVSQIWGVLMIRFTFST